ncbi:MAG: hypothetical protein MPW15_22575 [Candidatus Manganitrophus sp.]|nr:hypothetical protein [Candidatus Manganitrophus sp.]
MPTIIAAPAAKTCAAGSTANPAVCGQASMIETTALGTTTTVVVSLATDWATTNSAAGVMGTAPTVNWESKIVQSEMIGGGTFDQTLSGSVFIQRRLLHCDGVSKWSEFHDPCRRRRITG